MDENITRQMRDLVVKTKTATPAEVVILYKKYARLRKQLLVSRKLPTAIIQSRDLTPKGSFDKRILK